VARGARPGTGYDEARLRIRGRARAGGSSGGSVSFMASRMVPAAMQDADSRAENSRRAVEFPQGTLDDFHGAIGTATGPLRIQLSEKKFAKMFGEFSSEVKEIK
jgi:hypothetical protein